MLRRLVIAVVACLVGLVVVPSGWSAASSKGASTGRVWLSISTGGLHTCAIQRDHTLWCWGANNNGQLGTGNITPSYIPVQAGTDDDWAQVAAGNGHTCGIRADHTLWCWGANDHGQLGLGPHTPGNRLIPTRVGSGQDWAIVATGYLYTCGLRLDDSLWCWGDNRHHQLGLGDMTRELRPTQVAPDATWTRVSVENPNRFAHSCAVQADETLWCWGDNSSGQLGLGDTDDRTLPTRVGTGVDWDRVGVAGDHTCAIRTDHTLWCWGSAAFGELGLGQTGDKSVPTQVGTDTDWVDVQLGAGHSCGTRRDDSSLWCWGYNILGQLGLGDTTNRLTPTQVEKSARWSHVDGGTFYTCAIRRRHTLWCWGYNHIGQLGVGDRTDRRVPTQV